MLFVEHKSVKGNSKSITSDKKIVKRVVRLLRVVLSVGKVEFRVRMGGMVVVGGVLVGGLGMGDTVEGLVSVLIGLLHLSRCLGVGIVVGLSEGGIVVMGGNVVVKALGGKVNVMVCMCGNVVVGGIVGICVKVAVGGIVSVSGRVAVGSVVIISVVVVMGGAVGISVEVTVGGIFSFGAMAVGGGNVIVGMGFGSTVVVNVIDIVCRFCFCCVEIKINVSKTKVKLHPYSKSICTTKRVISPLFKINIHNLMWNSAPTPNPYAPPAGT